MTTVTSSSLGKFRECPKKYWFEYELKRLPVSESPALSFGKIFHEVLEKWWKTGMDGMIEFLIQKAKDGMDEQTASQIVALLKHYRPPRSEAYEVVGVEQQFEIQIQSPYVGRPFRGYRLAGKIDLVLRNVKDGSLWVVDHKTTTQEIIGFGSYWQALQVDAQMNNYCLAVGAVGFIYDVIRKPSIKLCKKDEARATHGEFRTASDAYQSRVEGEIGAEPETYYQWRVHQKGEEDFWEARKDLWQWCEMHRACCNDERFPRNSNSCVGRYGTCPYLEVCAGRASIEDDALFRTKVETNEELE